MSTDRIHSDPVSTAQDYAADMTAMEQRMWLSKSRERRAKLMDAIAVTLLIVLMAALGVLTFAATAKADDLAPSVVEYVERYGRDAVCPVLDDHNSVAGMLGVLLAIEGDGFTQFEAGQIVGVSVMEFCPRNQELMQRFVAVYGKTDVA